LEEIIREGMLDSKTIKRIYKENRVKMDHTSEEDWTENLGMQTFSSRYTAFWRIRETVFSSKDAVY
jgi:hypothetical protein